MLINAGHNRKEDLRATLRPLICYFKRRAEDSLKDIDVSVLRGLLNLVKLELKPTSGRNEAGKWASPETENNYISTETRGLMEMYGRFCDRIEENEEFLIKKGLT